MSDSAASHSRLLSVSQMAASHPAFTEASLRWLIFKAADNGLDRAGAIHRVGRKVLLDEQPFLDWVRQSQPALPVR